MKYFKVENTLYGNIEDNVSFYFISEQMSVFDCVELNELNINQKMKWKHLIIERVK